MTRQWGYGLKWGILLFGAFAVAPFPGLRQPLAAQAPLFLVDPDTGVRSVGFRFLEGRSLDEGVLRDQIAMAGPGVAQRIRESLDFLPFLSPPTYEPFHPPQLLRDRARLERFLRAEGFPDARVEYRVTLDSLANVVDVLFDVWEGEPVRLGSVEVRGTNGGPLWEELPTQTRPAQNRFQAQLQRNRGRRMSEGLEIRIRDEVANWLRNRGFPFPTLSSTREEGPDGILLALTVDPGSRMRVGQVSVEGNDLLSDAVLLREIPLRPGDWFSSSALTEGERELLGLDMVRFAAIRGARSSEDSSRLTVQAQVEDGLPRLVRGQVGYSTTAGIAGDAAWSHRNFRGGARVLELSGTARTGLLSPEERPVQRYGLSLLLRQPHFFHRRLSGLVRPFSEYRDDLRDRSVELGSEASVLFERGPRRSVTLRYGLTSRYILDARPGGTIGRDENLAELLARLDSLDLDRRTSSLSLTTRWGQGGMEGRSPVQWDFLGSLELAGPPVLSTVEYGKIVLEGMTGIQIQPWVRLSARAGVARVFPFGASIPAPDGSNRLETYLKLRDATLTAGGSRDVRGWGSELLGPKIPDLDVDAGDGHFLPAGTYIPLGGLARWTASVQVEFPFPFVAWPHGAHLFLDAGRVWTPDQRFLPTEDPLVPGQKGNRPRLGTGAGITVSTPVGPVQLDLGYKVNPSLLDVRSPGAVARALTAGESVESVPAEPIRRWHLHFSIGGIR